MYVCANQKALNSYFFVDLTDKSSFERAKYWVNELKTYEDVSIINFYVVY